MWSFESTVLVSSLLGALGGVFSHSVWLIQVSRLKAAAGKRLSAGKALRNNRIRLLALSLGLGAIAGFLVAVVGFQAAASTTVVFALACAAGIAPTAVLAKLGKLSGA